MTLEEAKQVEGGAGKVYIPHLKVNAYIAYVADDEERALVLYRLEKGGRTYEEYFYLDQLKKL